MFSSDFFNHITAKGLKRKKEKREKKSGRAGTQFPTEKKKKIKK